MARSLDATRLLFDLHQASEIIESLAGLHSPVAIAQALTEGLIERFDCAFTRLWLLDAEAGVLNLVASAGMYTRTDGFFSRVPLGAYKVGKIAQNRMAFLSNNLAAEAWVGNREWAIANAMIGFAGYPLMLGTTVIGVIAVFSQKALAPEFLEVLQSLGTVAALILDPRSRSTPPAALSALSDQIAAILSSSRTSLEGIEVPLSPTQSLLLLHLASDLHGLDCRTCRLSYASDSITLTALIPQTITPDLTRWHWLIQGLGGELELASSINQRAVQLSLRLPLTTVVQSQTLAIASDAPLVYHALSQLAQQAGYRLSSTQPDIVLSDHAITSTQPLIWFDTGQSPLPPQTAARLSFAATPADLIAAVTAISNGQTWGLTHSPLSEREVEMLYLLSQGLRDRDIAEACHISESTVKFHMNNVLEKLTARTRYQAIFKALQQGWL